MRAHAALLTLALASALPGCRQPSADLKLPDPVGAEPPAGTGPSLIVEAPPAPGPEPELILDPSAVDDRLASLIDGERYRVAYDLDHPWAGASVPLVTIVVFTDYQCPYCAKLDDSLRQLRAHYPELRVVWRQYPLPFHGEAELAARYTLAAQQQGAHLQIHEWAFDNRHALSVAGFEHEAEALGLDVDRLRADAASDWIVERVASDKAAAQALGITGTPTSFVNGRLLSGAVPIEQFEAIIAEELQLADALLVEGSERREVWARILAASAPGPIVR